MRQQVLSPDHPQGILGKKTSSRAGKGEDFSENGRRSVGDAAVLNEEKSALKMPGGRLKGSFAHHSKDHKVSKDLKDRAKDEKEDKESNDHSKAEEGVGSKAPETTEANEEEAEVQNRRSQDGETLLQWGQRKRPRHRDSSGQMTTSIRADRRVVRAEKQVVTQPVSQPRASSLRPSNVTIQEAASGTGRRTPEEAGGAATTNRDSAEVLQTAPTNRDHDHTQLNTAHPPPSGDEDDIKQHPVLFHSPEKGPPPRASTGHAATVAANARTEPDTSQGKSPALEKVNLELFEWPKIMISLTRKEKEEDFALMKGTKLPQRPKRRPKTVEKNVQFICPGTWLCDLTRERYEVKEKKAVKKKPRGLKAMGSVDTESE